MKPILRVENLSKKFGKLPVIHQVSFSIQPGEVVGLTGNIGSGKSVLVMLLAGLYEADEGEIYFGEGQLIWPFSAQSLGMGVIHQKPSLDDLYDVSANIFLGNEIGWPRWLGPLKILDRDRMHREAARILAQLGVQINSIHEKVTNLSAEQRQMIAIAKVLTYAPRVVIVDEPTVLLSYPFQQVLLNLIQSWRQQGISVLFSSNNMDHLFTVTDRIIILNQGHKVADLRTDETSREAVVRLLIGSADSPKSYPTIWSFDSYDRVREYTEKLSFQQMLLEKDLAAEDSLNRQLTRQLADQVQALDKTNLALLEAQGRLLIEREQERKHLARELHDQIIQDLLSINYELESIEIDVDSNPDLPQNLADVRQGIRELVENLRRICNNLRPPTIDSLGLGAAIQSYIREWSGRSGVEAVVDLDPNLRRLPESTEVSIFRIVQEGLNNVWRHAQASSVDISLKHTSPRTILLTLRDNGKGLPDEVDIVSLADRGHFGLMGISERVALLGGRFRLEKIAGGGTQLFVEIPHPRGEASAETEAEFS